MRFYTLRKGQLNRHTTKVPTSHYHTKHRTDGRCLYFAKGSVESTHNLTGLQAFLLSGLQASSSK
jgi:hypothetical protein